MSLPLTPDEAAAVLTDPSAPYLVGVRHHAPSLAAALPALLDGAEPDVLLVELPGEMQEWLHWLAHEDTRAPVALAAAPGDGGGGPAFYPFADFSPELAAVRWAARRGVPVVACDLPLADRAWDAGRTTAPTGDPRPGLHAALRARLTGRPGDDLWDRLVEATAPGSPPEALRRAALLTGWALRRDAAEGAGVPALDLRREQWMRARVAEAVADGRRAAVVVGAFHAPALVPAGLWPRGTAPEDEPEAPDAPHAPQGGAAWTTSLIPYAYPLLDERSGYPAGIRDPEWQHMVLEAAGDPGALDEVLTRAAVRICAELRSQGHPSGPADAREISRLAGDLARLRGLPAAGRGELVEAVQTVLAQGEPYGRGRAVARAMERVLVGTRGGRPAPGAPRSGLAPAVEAELAALGLPAPGPDAAAPADARDLRLDPLRSDLDRRRELLLRRLTVCGVPYAEPMDVRGAAGTEGLTTRWEVRWTPATAAMLTAAGVRGVTALQAAEGVLRERRRQETDEGGPMAAQTLAGLAQAAECGLPALAGERLAETGEVLPASGTLPELLAGLALLDRVRAGHIAGLGADEARAARVTAVAELLTAAAVRQVDGLTGSEDPADAHALLELAHRADLLGGVRLTDALARLAADGSPLMRGAAGAVRVLLGHETAETLGARAASWVDAAGDPDSRAALTARLTGLLTAAGPLLEAAPPALEPLLDRVGDLPDRAFLSRLPALRGGFDTLSPAARDRLLAAVEERLDAEGIADTAGVDPVALATWTRADLAARAALDRLALLPRERSEAAPTAATAAVVPAEPAATHEQSADAAAREDGPAGPAATPFPADPAATASPDAPPGATIPDVAVRGDGPAVEPAASADSASGTAFAPDIHVAAREGGPTALASPDAPHGATTPDAAVRGDGLVAGPESSADSVAGTAPVRSADAASSGTQGSATTPGAPGGAHPAAARTLAPAARWRLVLGRRGDRLPPSAAALATALDELYGNGRGEGSRGDLGGHGAAGDRGGREAPYPGVREWSEELAALFGPGIREEVLATAAASGRKDVVAELDPDSVRPSVDLLRTVLRHAGGLPEARLAALRPLVRRLVEALTRQLATRLRPALHGTALPRPSRRPGGGLDLARTLRANLATARRAPDGTVQVIPERPVFRARAQRAADWRLILVTDVSGSMEASTIWAALTASVLAGVPTLSTHFLAFSTEVIDLTDHVADPLSLLLEVSVGGGTHIAAGLRHARELVTVPSRTLVVVVSDFEEGYPLGGLLAEVRALVGAGCHVLGCASLDDAGRPRYSTGVAGQLVAAGMPVAALSPLELARWVGEKIT
ncbi:vWA domain-containing protein [Actinacidiphila glaucinigra]|uniref:vWA domain-containing protein n=1 Tax=Actinacidiphila glaucinigra TaxID=235986 RepID=UPI0035E269D9